MKKLSFLFGIGLIILSACQQEHEMAIPHPVDPPVTPQEPQTSLVQSVTVGNETSIYTYDDQQRKIKSVNSDGSRSEIEYLEGLAIQRIYNADGSLNYFTTYEINEEGLRTSRTVSNNASYLETYAYDSDSRILKSTSVNGANVLVSNHYYSKGNLDSTVYIRNDALVYTYRYTYITKPNTIDNKAYGTPYYGTDSKNLLKNWIGVNPAGKIFLQASWAYTYDSKGRVANMTQVVNDDVDTFTYTYY